MPKGLNRQQIIGNVGTDINLKELRSGKVAEFRVAVNGGYKGSDGEWVEKTEWFNIVVFNTKLAEVVAQYVSKGQPVYIEGPMETRSWEDRDGNTRYITELKAYTVHWFDRAPRDPNEAPRAAAPKKQAAKTSEPDTYTFDAEDDLPF